MTQLGAIFAVHSRAGDVLCLNGDLGVGKSRFAQGFIRHYFNDPEMDVPSPTFLIDQCYEDPRSRLEAGDPQKSWPSVHHMDFYRFDEDMTDEMLRDNFEILELEQAFQNDICLIEWGERLRHTPTADVLHLDITYDWDLTSSTSGNDPEASINFDKVGRHVVLRQPLPQSWLEDADASHPRIEAVLDKWHNRKSTNAA